MEGSPEEEGAVPFLGWGDLCGHFLCHELPSELPLSSVASHPC